jgi:hypothetical protein
MFKKVMILASLFVLLLNFLPNKIHKAHALGIDTAIRIVAGSMAESTLLSMAEKAGFAVGSWSAEDKRSYVGAVNEEIYNKTLNKPDDVKQTYANLLIEMNKQPSPDPFKKGYGFTTLKAGMWLLGADLIYRTYKNYDTAFKNGLNLTKIMDMQYALKAGEGFLNIGDVWISSLLWSGTQNQIRVSWITSQNTTQYSPIGYFLTGTAWSAMIISHTTNTVKISWNAYNGSWNGSAGDTFNVDATALTKGNSTRVSYPAPSVVPPIVVPAINTNLYDNSIPDPVNVVVPSDYPPNVFITVPVDPDTIGQQLEPYTGTINDPVSVDEQDPSTAEPPDKPAGSSWWEWLLKPLMAIGDFFKNIFEWLLGLVVPSDGFFQGMFDDSFSDFNAKMPVIDQLSTFFTSVKSVSTEGTIPKFEMTMPPSFGGGTFNIIDFKLFTDYRTLILNIIRFISWFVFLKRLYARIPRMIY